MNNGHIGGAIILLSVFCGGGAFVIGLKELVEHKDGRYATIVLGLAPLVTSLLYFCADLRR